MREFKIIHKLPFFKRFLSFISVSLTTTSGGLACVSLSVWVYLCGFVSLRISLCLHEVKCINLYFAFLSFACLTATFISQMENRESKATGYLLDICWFYLLFNKLTKFNHFLVLLIIFLGFTLLYKIYSLFSKFTKFSCF